MIRFLFVLLLLSPGALYAQEDEQFSIGAMIHVTGEYAQVGEAFSRGIELGMKVVNSRGGFAGKTGVLVLEDTGYDLNKANGIAKKLLEIDKVDAAIVSNYTEIMRVGPVFERAKVPTITLWDSSPDMEALGDFIFGIGIWAPSSVEVAVKAALKDFSAKTAAVFSSNGEWSLSVAEGFTKGFEQGGGKILLQTSFNPGETDFRSAITRLKAIEPDVIYAPLSDDAPSFFQQLASAGLKSKIITSDVLDEAVLSELGKAVEGIFQTQAYLARTPALDQFQKAYWEHFGENCEQLIFTALGYDSVLMLEEAAKISQKEDLSLNDAMYRIQELPGISRTISVSVKGSAPVEVKLFEVRDEKFELYSTSSS